jgi:hypothetical protein
LFWNAYDAQDSRHGPGEQFGVLLEDPVQRFMVGGDHSGTVLCVMKDLQIGNMLPISQTDGIAAHGVSGRLWRAPPSGRRNAALVIGAARAGGGDRGCI